MIGIYLQPMIIPAAFAAGEFPAELVIERERLSQEDVDIAKRGFLESSASNGVRGEWHCLRDDGESRLRQLARCCDIAILGQVDPDAPERAAMLRPEDLILVSGRPNIVVPYIGAQREVGRSVVIAWDGGREAARAVSDALPLLRAAQSVHVLSIGSRFEDGAGPGGSLSNIVNFLADHGIEAKSDVLVSSDIGAAELLLSRLADMDADLLVMGCYGHARVRELLLGGMTREILGHMTVPVFMSH